MRKKTKTLRNYYQGLPEATYPKRDFVNRIVSLTGVSTATVRNWIAGMKPQNPHHIEILSDETGIPRDELWTD